MIQAQILYRKPQAIGREVGDNLRRISRSPVLSQDRAFALQPIFTNELKIAVQHQYEPEHLFALKESVENLFDYFSFDIADGDVFAGRRSIQRRNERAVAHHGGAAIP
nr:hydantoinase B/oxoprolinase family protein [Bacillus licheniformis]